MGFAKIIPLTLYKETPGCQESLIRTGESITEGIVLHSLITSKEYEEIKITVKQPE